MTQFTAKLIEKSTGSTIKAFAHKLGITPSEWSRIKHGHRRPSQRIQQKALALWPELAFCLADDARATQTREVA